MFCPYCSFKNPEQAKFCGKCGGSLPSANTSNPPTPKDNFQIEKPAVSEGLKWGILIASIFIPIIGIVGGIIYMQDANPENKSAGKLWLYGGLIMAFIYMLSMG